LEEAIRKLKHCHEQSKRNPTFKHGWKANENTKGKWPEMRARFQDAREQENVALCKKFNATKKGHGSQPGEHKNKGKSKEPLRCFTCGVDYRRRDVHRIKMLGLISIVLKRRR